MHFSSALALPHPSPAARLLCAGSAPAAAAGGAYGQQGGYGGRQVRRQLQGWRGLLASPAERSCSASAPCCRRAIPRSRPCCFCFEPLQCIKTLYKIHHFSCVLSAKNVSLLFRRRAATTAAGRATGAAALAMAARPGAGAGTAAASRAAAGAAPAATSPAPMDLAAPAIRSACSEPGAEAVGGAEG